MTTIRMLDAGDDLSDLIRLSREFFAEYEAHHPQFFKIDEVRDEDVIRYFGRTVGADDSATFIAVEDGRTVGYVTVLIKAQPGYWRIKRVGDISGLMVRQDRRGQGIGRRLMETAAGFFREQGVGHFTVYTAVTNETAVRFYQECGMEPLYVTLLGTAVPDASRNP